MTPRNRYWSLREIVAKLVSSPGCQFHIYASDKIPPGRQREVVSYKGGMTRGMIKRSTMAESSGVRVDPNYLYKIMAQDCARYRQLFFTFMTSPVFGMASTSENRSYLENFQSLYPMPMTNVTA